MCFTNYLLIRLTIQWFKLTRTTFIVACFLLVFITNVKAAVQGDEGLTSTGSVDVTVVIDQLALINGLNDINLGSWSGVGDLTGTDAICVALTGTTFGQSRNYHIRASGNGDASNSSAFTLSNGSTNIYYRVFLDDADDSVELLPGQISFSNQFVANFGYILNLINNACIFPNATITVTVEESELANGSGTHSGILTLELIPE